MGGADADLNFDIFGHDRGGADAFDKVGDAADRTTKRFKENEVGAKRLSHELADTRRHVADLRQEFDKTGDIKLLKEITKGEKDIKRWAGWLDQMPKDAAKSVGVLGQMSGVLSGLPISGPVALAAGVAAIPAAATLAGVALTGLGVGAIALGAMSVRGSKQVTESWSQLKSTAASTFTSAGRSMERPIAGAIDKIRGTVRDLGPDLRTMFDSSALHVDNLASGVDGLARETMPGLTRAVEASGGVVDTFAAKLPETGAVLSDFFDDMAESAEGGSTALATTMGFINGTIGGTGEVIKGAAKAFDFFSEGPGRFAGNLGIVTDFYGKTGDAAAEAENQIDPLRITVEDTATAFDRLHNAQMRTVLSLAGAQTSASESRRRLNESLQDGSKSFQLGTEAGDRNRSMLENASRAAYALREQAEGTAIAQGRATTATAEGAKAYGDYVYGLVSTLRSAKLTESQINELMVTFGLMPEGVATNITTPGARPSKTDVQVLKEKIDSLEDKSVRAAARADYSEVLRLRIQMDALRDKLVRVSIRTTYTSTGQGANNYVNPGRLQVDKSRWGNVYSFAGGGVQARVAGPGTLYQWAEPETGGEAFIPRRGNLGRSRGIAEGVVEGWLGGKVMWPGEQVRRAAAGAATGGFSGGGSGRMAATTFNFNGPVTLTTVREAEGLLLEARERLIRQGRW